MPRPSAYVAGLPAVVLLLFGTASWALALAQGAADKDKVKVDFNTSVMVPGMTLPAGTYVFRLADHRTNDTSSRSGMPTRQRC